MNELPQLEQQLHNPLGSQPYHVVLFIDGFIVKVQRPDGAGDAYFCGRHGKSCDSINVQYVTDKQGRIRHIITGCAGSTHDKTAASWSAELKQFLDNLPHGYVMLGDPAYRGLHPNVITTFTGHNLPPDRQQYNNACTHIPHANPSRMTDCKLDGSEFGLNALQCSQFLPFNSQSLSFQLQLAILQPSENLHPIIGNFAFLCYRFCGFSQGNLCAGKGRT